MKITIKQTVIVLLGLIILLGVFLIRSIEGDTQPAEIENHADGLLFSHVDLERLTFLELIYPDRRVLLARQQGAWHLPEWRGFPADGLYVRLLLQAIARTPRGKVITEDPSQYPLYHLDQRAKRVVLKNAGGQAAASFLVGKASENVREAYIRLDGEETVRLVGSDLVPALSRITWGERTVWRLIPDLIEEVFVTGFAVDFHAVKRSEGEWQLIKPASGYRLSDAFRKPFLPTMAFLRAGNLAFAPDARGFQPRLTIHVVTRETTLTLALAGPQNGVVQARKGLEPVFYQFHPSFIQLVEGALQPH